MAKKNITSEKVQAATPLKKIEKQTLFLTSSTLVPLIVCALYFAVHFLPDFDGYDGMGFHWLYLVVLDMLVIVFLAFRKDDYENATVTILKNTFSKLFLAFFILAGLSTITAINPTEAWVCYVRLIATIIAFFNISILLHKRNDLFKILAHLLALILLVESYQAITLFLNGFGNTPLTELVMSLKGKAGNKNIFAAGLAVKIPFVIYLIHTGKIGSKVFSMFVFILGSLSIFIINARATYLSLLLILIMYMAYCLFLYWKEKKLEQTLTRIGLILIPLIIAFFVSQIEISTVLSFEDESVAKGFGSVSERLSSVAQTNDESNQVRLRLWSHAIDYTKKHPLIGCGYGNWKIASIPYQRLITNDLYVPIHAHNDYLEAFAELGIPGGLLYLSLYVCLLVFTLKTLFSKAKEETKMFAVFSLISFSAYAVDALFNFPMERPISQLFFAFIAALNVGAYIKGREEQFGEKQPSKKAGLLKLIYLLITFLLLIPSTYVTYLTYKSLIVQRNVLGDLNNEPLKLDWKMVVPSFPPIPNLSATAQPIASIKGRYLYEAGKMEESLVLLEKGRKDNPVIGYSEFLKAGVYFRMGKYDSAARNAGIAFYMRPKAKTYFQTYVAVLAKQKDTANIKKAFAEYDSHRHHPFGWNLYLMGMLNSTGKGNYQLLAMADSAIKIFATYDSTVNDLKIRRQEILGSMNAPVIVNNGITPAFLQAQKYYASGISAFGAGKLENAAQNFIKASELNPNDYIIYENIAMSYFNMANYKKALVYFDKALSFKTCVNGKSEFFKGVALINLGKNEEGCGFLKISKSKKYKEKEAELDNILKTRCGV